MTIPDIKKSPYKIFIYYAIGALLLFAVINCIGLIPSSSVQILFFFILCAYLFAGIVHTLLLTKFLGLTKPEKSLLFTLVLMLLGFIVVFLLNRFIFQKSSHALFTLGVVIFPLPLLFMYSLHLFLNIPEKIYKKWYYPVDHDMPNLDLLDLTRVLIIQFEFLKSTNETSPTNFKAKAPNNMPFSELFYIFINDYNESHPQNIIEVFNNQQTPYPWIFTIQKPWWKRTHYVDPDLTFHENGIVNNDIIFCQRVNP